ncbi:3157_t:CDS:2 [Paraglomus occultum]|uniref:3157_t:CDS:1 n=1 Tax=Paraglomus occultum TaxID=144539 RepID=A0A9N9G365_9GLOM|nr:3157_t:CDS:2 [Paraglomus occultum]
MHRKEEIEGRSLPQKVGFFSSSRVLTVSMELPSACVAELLFPDFWLHQDDLSLSCFLRVFGVFLGICFGSLGGVFLQRQKWTKLIREFWEKNSTCISLERDSSIAEMETEVLSLIRLMSGKRDQPLLSPWQPEIGQGPLYYYLIDHSGQHVPIACRPVGQILSKNEALVAEGTFSPENLFDVADTYMLSCFICIQSKHPDDTPVKTEKERNIKELVTSIFMSITKPEKDNLSETEHTTRNVMPLLDATVGLDTECRIHYYGERTLEVTADRRNEGSDPFERARDGYKVDGIIEHQELGWLPTIGCGEISGGLPRCTRDEEWKDTLKLGLELRDIWRKAQKDLVISAAHNLIVWGFTVVGRKLCIYALGVAGGLFHLVLVKEVALPSSRSDLVNL